MNYSLSDGMQTSESTYRLSDGKITTENTYCLSDGKITTEFSDKVLCSRCVSAFRRGRYLCKRTDRGDMKRRVCDNCGTLTMCGEFAVSVDRILTARHTARNNGRK